MQIAFTQARGIASDRNEPQMLPHRADVSRFVCVCVCVRACASAHESSVCVCVCVFVKTCILMQTSHACIHMRACVERMYSYAFVLSGKAPKNLPVAR
jgi:hypothetical protein